jgi:hypothetical protein
MNRDFMSLTAQEALHVAIFIEERNAEIYHQFAEMFAEFRDPESLEIAATFWDMANEERKHGTLLQKRYFDRYGTRPCAVTEEDIGDFIEVPHLENGEIFTFSKLKVGRSPRQMALEIAMAAEPPVERNWREPDIGQACLVPFLRRGSHVLRERFEGHLTRFRRALLVGIGRVLRECALQHIVSLVSHILSFSALYRALEVVPNSVNGFGGETELLAV